MKLIKHILAGITLLVAGSNAATAQQILITPPINVGAESERVASIAGPDLRVSYMRSGQALGCIMEAKVNSRWEPFGSPLEDNKVFVITGPEKLRKPNYKKYYPGWNSADTITTNPYLSGNVCEAVPVSARNIDKNTIEVEYVTAGDHTVKGYWTLSDATRNATLNLEFTPAKDGCYSLGVLGLHAPLPSAVTAIQMPPMYQYKRIPASPEMLLSVMMPTPVAMVETAGRNGAVTAFVSADNTLSEGDWGGVDNAPIGFAILNPTGMAQPVAFAPVMGMPDSKMKAGEKVARSFQIGLSAAPWNETLEYVVSDVYKVRDYRKQEDKSLTETMFSIIDLMNDDEFGGWDSAMRGHYDIEGKPTKAPTVVHSAPLAVVGAAITAGDEEMYLNRALPTIEYTLSRKGYRWSSLPTDEGYNKDPETLRLNPIGSQFTTTYFEGLHKLLGGRNAWLVDIAMPDGEPRAPRGYSAPILSWVQALAAYRLTGNDKWLRRATSVAERDAKLHIYANSTKPMRYQAFYNSTIYAPWWDFVDLYEATGDKQYLDAARYGAAQTIAGIRSWPQVHDSTQTIHPGGVYNGNATMWWKGSEQFRLGFPRQEGDAPEHEVEQWRVSPVGLGFEQPSTYFLRTKGKLVRPVFMSSWAPAMLRINAHTGLDLFDTYARNAVLGRFTNYPGYYATGFTDLTMDERFPYEGPDVSSIYYHHIPPHLAFTTDYLVTEAIQRSQGKVQFPWGRQEGFVWFSNRVYGGAPGTVFDDKDARLWMRKGLIESSAPQVNYLTAVSGTRFWILLSNEAQTETATTVTLSPEVAALVEANPVLAGVKGKNAKPAMDGNTLTVELAPKGFTAISLPLKSDPAANNASLAAVLGLQNAPVLKDGYKKKASGTPAGDIHTFRIRSPFGWDSVYGFCETPPVEGVSVEVSCGDKTVNIDTYPYEWSFAKFGFDEKAVVTVKVTDAEGTKTHTIEI